MWEELDGAHEVKIAFIYEILKKEKGKQEAGSRKLGSQVLDLDSPK